MTKGPVKPFPAKDERDLGYRVARTTVGAVPYLGGSFQELLDIAIGMPSAKRQEEWYKSLGEILNEVCIRVDGLTPQMLSQNEEFQTVVATATEIALRNHREEKLQALRNIVKNTAEGFQIDEVLRNHFLSLIDRFAPVHIVVLRLHDNPASSPQIFARAKGLTMGSFRILLKAALPACSDALLDQVEQDLAAERLITVSTVTMTVQGLMASHSTPRGKAFLEFIS